MSARRDLDPSELAFTGERLHAEDGLFSVDLMRHRAAYRYAIELARERGAQTVLELGSGTGHGTLELANALPRVVAVDRVAPLLPARSSRACFVRADLDAMPLGDARFDLVVSFQVIEHLADPTRYLDAIAHHLAPTGVALITTPNRLQSDGENPFHVREYSAPELSALIQPHFERIEMLGVGARGEAARYHAERLRRIRRMLRIDPLGLRRALPRGLVEWLFARAARLVRRGIAVDGALPEVDFDDFPIGPAETQCLDLMAVCHRRRR